jgi:hypothetical protein
MWQIIKAEYSYTLFQNKLRTLATSFFAIMFLLIFFHGIDLLISYTLFGAIIISLHDDRRFYIYGTLPIKKTAIAITRLVMLSINLSFTTVFFLPIIFYTHIKTSSFILVEIGILLLVRIFSFILSDTISNYSLNKKKTPLVLISLFIVIIVGLYAKITTYYFQNPDELKWVLIILSYPLALILAIVSVKTFSLKEKVFFKEKA